MSRQSFVLLILFLIAIGLFVFFYFYKMQPNNPNVDTQTEPTEEVDPITKELQDFKPASKTLPDGTQTPVKSEKQITTELNSFDAPKLQGEKMPTEQEILDSLINLEP